MRSNNVSVLLEQEDGTFAAHKAAKVIIPQNCKSSVYFNASVSRPINACRSCAESISLSFELSSSTKAA